MRRVELSANDWSVSAFLATSLVDRLLGTFRVPPGAGLVIRTRSVHSFGQTEPMTILGLDAGMRVVAAGELLPNRIAFLPSARVIVELPSDHSVPSMNDLVEMTDG